MRLLIFCMLLDYRAMQIMPSLIVSQDRELSMFSLRPTRHASLVFHARFKHRIHKGFLCFTTKAKRRVKAFSSLPHQQQQLRSTKSLMPLRIQKLNTPQPRQSRRHCSCGARVQPYLYECLVRREKQNDKGALRTAHFQISPAALRAERLSASLLKIAHITNSRAHH